MYDFGHATIQIIGMTDGAREIVTGGFYPTAPFDSLEGQPQKGIVQTANEIGKEFDVSKGFLIPNPATSIDEIKDFVSDYDDTHNYDLDDNSCTTFVIDCIKEMGGTLPPGFGEISHDGKVFTAPSAVGGDLKSLDFHLKLPDLEAPLGPDSPGG